jgi:heterodisulfide reductase subunit A-like polyferredoxin/coenzyme F420-reducing hydrogenase delta subunit
MPEEKPKISVVLCSCGGALSEKIDLERLAEFARDLPDVVSVRTLTLLCRRGEERQALEESLRKEKVDRVVFAGCSPGISEDLLDEILRSAGIHPGMAAICDLREQCAWVIAERTRATERALLLLRGGIDRVRRISPHFEDRKNAVRNRVIVLGGGVAGVETALQLSRLEHPVILVEREHELAGVSAEAIKADENIQVMTATTISRCRGFAGDFEVCLDRNGEKTVVEAGAIVIATGAARADVEEDYGFHAGGKILTQAALEEILFAEQEARVAFPPGTVVFYLLGVVGEQGKLNTIAALKQALLLARNLGCRVFVGCEDVKVAGPGLETLYREVRDSGVIFFKYGSERPEVLADASGLRVKIRDALLSGGTVSDVLSMRADMVVLEQRFEPAAGASELQRILRIDTGPDGFFQSDNVFRLPALLNRKGIFVAGSARLPQTVEECVADAGSAALAVHQFLREGSVTVVAGRNAVEKGRCTLCLTCYRLCPQQAISWSRAAEISDVACQACGVCSSDCPAVAIQLKTHTNEQVTNDLELRLGDRLSRIEGGIVAFCCRQSATVAAESAGARRTAFPAGLHVIPVPCSGKIDVLHLLKAFECGADGVLVFPCRENNCKYLSGNIRARKRVAHAKARLEAIGIAPERLELCNISSIQPGRFVRAVEAMVETVRRLGPAVGA